ncbi:MAG TPA: ATP-dependent Clp protease proteolytic subunit [Streptosporangiaceae bacterium]|jgi:ATP-dependent Clp protease protease subunit|nr:ATP-dependent Clp protease proteolytic subunit [Streptosporangiaceae bacterium]
MTTRAHIPGRPGAPGEPSGPGDPFRPAGPFVPGLPIRPGEPYRPLHDPLPPTRIWQPSETDPQAGWQAKLYEQLLAKRIVLAAGILDDQAATRLSAQLLTLDADGGQPIRLELQNLRAELPAAITVMGILDVMHATVHGCASGETAGPALALLASCPQRSAYPNATFTLTEPSVSFDGTASAIAAREQQVLRMMDTFYYRLAEATGREPDEIREDARRGRVLTAAQAVGYGLIQDQITREDP